MARTLADLNAGNESSDWVWGDSYKLRTVYAVGSCGSQRGFRGMTGGKVHALRTDLIVEDLRPADKRGRNTYQQGDNFSVRGLCNGNGQNTGIVNKRADLDAVTCTKCRKALGLDAE